MAEPLKATFFTLKHRDRAVLLPATLVLIVLLALIAAAWAALNWGALLRIAELLQAGASQTKPQMDDAAAMNLMFGMFALMGWSIILLFPAYLVVAAYEAACLRWMIRGEAPGLFGLTLGADTWRVYGVYWCWFLAQMVVSSVASVFAMPLMFGSMGEIMRNPQDVDAMLRWQLSVQLPITLLQYLPMIFIGVRFGPAAATSIARHRFSPFDAWKVTRGRFWALLGSFALLWLIAAIVMCAAAAPLTLRMWPFFQDMWRNPGDEEAIRAYMSAIFSRDTIVWVCVSYGAMMIAGLWLALMSYGVNARAALAALEEGKIEKAAD
jgi:hypothetical protein